MKSNKIFFIYAIAAFASCSLPSPTSPVAIAASDLGDVVSTDLILFQDSTYCLIHIRVSEVDFYEGKYSLKRDTVRLDTNGLTHLYPTGSFVFRTDGSLKYLTAVSPGRSAASNLRITINNRSK